MEYDLEQQEKEPEWNFKQLLASPMLRLPLILVCSLAMLQQLSGINFVFYYSSSVFENGGVPQESSQYATLGVCFINFLMTGISVPLMERCGRRPLLLVGMALMAISMLLLTLALVFQEAVPWLSYISIVVTILYVIGFAVGLGSIPQFIPAELFTQGPRPPAMSIAGLLNWLCNFFVGIAFPSMQSTMGPYAFIFFMAMVVAFGILLYLKLPETKNKTYAELQEHFKRALPEEVTVQEAETEGLMMQTNGTRNGV